jgi:flagellar biosynthesis protein FlhG
MIDQADKLRQVIESIKLRRAAGIDNINISMRRKTARVITITSGKGGVGKTNIAVNLAIALSELGLRIIILDADFGLANIDVLLGMIPKYTLVDVIHNRKNILEVLCDGPNNIKFISGGSGVEEMTRLDRYQLQDFVNNIALLDKITDVVIIDTGAGLSDNVMSFIMAADEVLLVATPEPTSITDAYALIKMISNRGKKKNIKVIINKAESASEGNDIINKLSIVADKFLRLQLFSLGYILQDDAVIKAVKQQQPFSTRYPKSHAAKDIRVIARKLADKYQSSGALEDAGAKGFINKLVRFLKN